MTNTSGQLSKESSASKPPTKGGKWQETGMRVQVTNLLAGKVPHSTPSYPHFAVLREAIWSGLEAPGCITWLLWRSESCRQERHVDKQERNMAAVITQVCSLCYETQGGWFRLKRSVWLVNNSFGEKNLVNKLCYILLVRALANPTGQAEGMVQTHTRAFITQEVSNLSTGCVVRGRPYIPSFHLNLQSNRQCLVHYVEEWRLHPRNVIRTVLCLFKKNGCHEDTGCLREWQV